MSDNPEHEWRVIGDSPLAFEMETISQFDAEWVRTRARKNGSFNVRIQKRLDPDHGWEDVAEDEYERRAAERLYPERTKP